MFPGSRRGNALGVQRAINFTNGNKCVRLDLNIASQPRRLEFVEIIAPTLGTRSMTSRKRRDLVKKK